MSSNIAHPSEFYLLFCNPFLYVLTITDFLGNRKDNSFNVQLKWLMYKKDPLTPFFSMQNTAVTDSLPYKKDAAGKLRTSVF